MISERTIDEIYMDVLGSIYRGYSDPRQLKLGAKLTQKSLDEVIEVLGEKDLVIEVDMGDGEIIEYFLTDKGLKAVDLYTTVNKIINQKH